MFDNKRRVNFGGSRIDSVHQISNNMQDIAASYIVGALGGIVYLRLLGRGVDSVAASGLGEAAGGALGQQRLLIPVILVLFYNRCDIHTKHCDGSCFLS